MANRKGGRKAGGKNKGYFFRSGRGWYATRGKQQIPLRDVDGGHLKDEKTPAAVLRSALARVLTSPVEAKDTVRGGSQSLVAVCAAYLSHVKREGASATFVVRADALWDLCYGLPAKYRPAGPEAFRSGDVVVMSRADAERDRIHAGLGLLPTEELKQHHLDSWLAAHPNWKAGGNRIRIQAVKRALNFAVERGLIEANPIKGAKIPKARGRITCITPDQEAALLDIADPAFAVAVRVCIRTGMRPGEFCAVERQHVHREDAGRLIVLPGDQTKTGEPRRIFVTDPGIIGIIDALCIGASGPIFKQTNNQPWHPQRLSQHFRRLKKRLEGEGMALDADACFYSLRHSYAKRMLDGFWSGKPINVETLARLMGNTPQVCRDHYVKRGWSKVDNEGLWQSA